MLPHFWELLPGALPSGLFFVMLFVPTHMRHIAHSFVGIKEPLRPCKQKGMAKK
jgi:hypothetical protein